MRPIRCASGGRWPARLDPKRPFDSEMNNADLKLNRTKNVGAVMRPLVAKMSEEENQQPYCVRTRGIIEEREEMNIPTIHNVKSVNDSQLELRFDLVQ